ncbi:MAG: hypothetical protein K6F09_04020 [Clostridiales bacterium]|nr:hypothetical protein [Clostridiales bacterium]
MVDVVLKLSEVPLHLYQITLGFIRLKEAGEIKLTVEKLSENSPERLPYNMLEANVGGTRIIYDMNDGYDNLISEGESYVDFYNGLLSRCDLMFKRSFNAGMNSMLSQPEKIKKTAPNFFVTSKGNIANFPVPCDPKREKIKKLIRMLPFSEFYNGHYYEKAFVSEPMINKDPKILFTARLWDPAGDFEGQIGKEKSLERHEINESRARCIRLCRKEFGSSFFGGITYSDFAQKKYPDVVMNDASAGKKNRYLEFMKTFDITIATMGLHMSTGWKFAEYLAASKAIVTEPLYYENIGALADGVNYLTFKNDVECVERIGALFDRDKRYKMMCANRDYYDRFMKSDVLIKNTLTDAGIL